MQVNNVTTSSFIMTKSFWCSSPCEIQNAHLPITFLFADAFKDRPRVSERKHACAFRGLYDSCYLRATVTLLPYNN